MNAEIYLIRYDEKALKEINKKLSSIAVSLKESDVNIQFKTEMNNDRLRIIQGIRQSIDDSEDIDLIIVPNSVGDTPGDSLVFRTLCGLTAPGITQEKVILNRLNEGAKVIDETDMPPVNDKEYADCSVIKNVDGERSGYCFFINGKRIVLVPEASGENLTGLIVKTVKLALTYKSIPQNELPLKGVGFAPTGSAAVGNAASDNGGKSLPVADISHETQEIDLSAIKEAITGIVDEKEQGGKKYGWFKRNFVPLKDDKRSEKVRKIILDFAIVVFIVTAVILLFVLVINPWLNNKKYDELRDIFNSPSSKVIDVTNPDGAVVSRKTISHNWDDIKAINEEIVGWVKIDNTVIDYPTLEHKGDNEDYQYYLYKDYYKNYSGYGSIFLDYRCKQSVNSKNVILHGHHMNDGSMFQNLMYYGKFEGDLEFYKKSPIIHFDTPEGDADYKIISYYKTNTLDAHGDFFDYLTSEFTSDAEFMNYVYLIRERSLINTPVTVNEDDQLLTLSTCSYEYSEFRTVLVARKVREGESSEVDVSKATQNLDALWPDVHYSSKDAKPKISTFSKAYKNNEIDWYDGKGNLSGKERMFTLHDNVPASTEPTDATGETEPQNEVVQNSSIWFNYSNIVMNKGESYTLEVYWDPDNTTDKSIKWNSNNSSVATIDSKGVVKGVGAGTATITATTSNGNTTTCPVTVHIPLEQVIISAGAYSMYEGDSHQLQLTIIPSDADGQSVSWSSSDTSVVTVDQNGFVTAHGAGTARVTATVNAAVGTVNVSCDYTIISPQNGERSLTST